MLLEESEVSEILRGVKPIEVELNKNDSINSMLTIRKWGFKAILEAVAKASLTDPSRLQLTVKLAYILSEFDFHLVERAMDRAGPEVCEKVLERVKHVIAEASKNLEALVSNRDALFTIDGIRRTPGGIFWRFLKEEIPKDDSKYIFKDNTKRQQGLRRQLVREKWTENHLTVLKGQKRLKLESEPELAEKLQTVKDIAASLSMSEVSIIERLVVKKGVCYARQVLCSVKEILSKSIDETSDRSLVMVDPPKDESARRRTPGGVFAQLVKSKSDISETDKKFIFARATGGRAPSMSDLMSMSLALQDRLVKRPMVAVSCSRGEEEEAASSWEFQRKVGNSWEPGFIGQENFTDPIPDLLLGDLKNSDSRDQVVAQIAIALKLPRIHLIEKMARSIPGGVAALVSIYTETVALERKGGVGLSESNPRRRTPLGVFIFVLRKNFGDALVNQLLAPQMQAAPQVVFNLGHSKGKPLADSIIVELEKLRIAESDFDIVRNIVSIKGEFFLRNLFEKVRKRFNKGKWLDTPGQLFGKMLKVGLSNSELNTVFASSSITTKKINPSLQDESQERCVQEVTIGLALIGVTANEVSTVERVIARLGEERAVKMLKRTKEIELEGGQRTRDEQRRKTPSGVFLSLLSTEEKVSKEDLKYIFEKPSVSTSSPEERKKEDTHFAPSLFTPVNPFRVIDNSGKDPEFIAKIKKQIRPALSQLEFISVLDPRLETVIRGIVLLGPSAIKLIDKCVHAFGEKRTEGWLEISHAQVTDSEAPVEQLPEIYNDLVKAAGGLPSLETTAGIRS